MHARTIRVVTAAKYRLRSVSRGYDSRALYAIYNTLYHTLNST